MATPARHNLASSEVVTIDRAHHLYHAARGLLSRRVCFPFRVGPAGTLVTVPAANAQRRREQSHRSHEFIDRNALQNLDVLEDFFGRLRSGSGLSLSLSQGECEIDEN